MIAWLRISVTLLILGLATLVLMPVQMLATRMNWRISMRLPYYWQKLACWVVGLRVKVVGQPAKPPLLITANHISWLDIPVLGSIVPLSFISKAEVATWPVLGTLARLQRTIFIDRTRRSKTASAANAIAERVGDGDVMVLFPEGTTGDGTRVLPFRSALIGAAGTVTGQKTITVQPVAVAYTGIQGLPVGRADCPGIAWYGDMDFIAHFRRRIGVGAIDAVVAFGEPITFDPASDRKEVTQRCYHAVREMFTEAYRHASSNGNGERVFSPASKDDKGTEKAPIGGYTAAGSPERIANRIP